MSGDEKYWLWLSDLLYCWVNLDEHSIFLYSSVVYPYDGQGIEFEYLSSFLV
jgi:hypothetical protein